MGDIIAFQPLLAIVSHTFFIAISFYALQAIMPEKIIKRTVSSKHNYCSFY